MGTKDSNLADFGNDLFYFILAISPEAPQTEPAATSSKNFNGVLHAPSTKAIAVVIALLLLAVAIVVLVKQQK